MSETEDLIPVPENEVPEIIEEAFEIEKPSASIDIPPEFPEKTYTSLEVQDIVSNALVAHIEKLGDRKIKKQGDRRAKKKENTRVGLTTLVFGLKALWTVVVSFCVIAAGFQLITQSDAVQLALIATLAIAQLSNTIAKYWFAEKSDDSDSLELKS